MLPGYVAGVNPYWPKRGELIEAAAEAAEIPEGLSSIG
jgi:hypothetical protein